MQKLKQSEGDQSSRRKERVKGSHSSQSGQLSQVCSAHSTSGDPNVMVRRIMRTTSSDSESSPVLKSGVNGSHLCRFSSDSGSHPSQADHDSSFRMESREVIKCSSAVSSLVGAHQQV